MPINKDDMKYGIKNALPPFSYATYGNLQILPSPRKKKVIIKIFF